MEFKEYLKAFSRYWLFIIIVACLGALLAFFYSRQLPQGYKNSQTFFITPKESQTNLEAFHAQEKARNFTDSAVAIITSADFKLQILAQGESQAVKKLAPQVLQITTFSKSSTQAKEQTKKTVSLFNDRFAASLQEVGPARDPAHVARPTQVYTVAGFVAGLAFAIFTISLKAYFKI